MVGSRGGRDSDRTDARRLPALELLVGQRLLVNVPIVVIALIGVLWVVPETADPGQRSLDIVGTLLVGASLVAVVDAIIEAPARGWTGPVTLGGGGRTRALMIFVWWELRVETRSLISGSSPRGRSQRRQVP